MPTVKVSGVNIDFPFQPYQCQIDYMSLAIDAITSSSNALLESPTGTGKTLCLLCSTLAWQKNAMQSAKTAFSSTTSDNSNQLSSRNGVGIIIYASRTHSQLKQVISELKQTAYHPRTTVLACNAQSARHACIYKNNLEGYNGNIEGVGSAATPIQDIEDLVFVGKKDKICPYFYTRDNSQSADLVLLPYNYLLESSIRNTLKIDWKDAIVIFDEAHNLERVASDASSFSLTSSDIAACVSELQHILKKLQQEEESKPTSDIKSEKNEKLPIGSVIRPNIHAVVRILKALFAIEERIDDIPLSRGVGNVNSCVHPGAWLIGMLDACGLTADMAHINIEEIRRCADLLMEDANASVGPLSSSSVIVPDPKLTVLAKSFARVFRGKSTRECEQAAADYRVFISDEEYTKQGTSGKKRTLNYWCFSPGLAMIELKKMGVQTIIMTSGTLSPLESFKEDMKIPFTIQLENPHVIQRSQIFVAAVPVGPIGSKLNSSYGNRDSSEYKNELGNSIFMICQTMGLRNHGNAHLPPGLDLKGGILVFFPSYGLMEASVEQWKKTGMYERLQHIGGGIIIEPRASASGGTDTNKAQDAKAAYKEKYHFQKPSSSSGGFAVNTGGSASVASVDDEGKLLYGLVAQLDAILASSRRCIMLAVCRGKVSEGIDFRDSKGRVVIITGIPYAPHMDPWVDLKKKYLDERREKPNAGPGGKVVSLTGQGWYNQAASRAVNQAVGRVIRHRNDWGAIFLLDDRFLADNQIAQLSSWVRSSVIKFPNKTSDNVFMESLRQFHAFAGAAMANPLLNEREAMPIRPVTSRNVPSIFKIGYEEEEMPGSGREIIIRADSIKDTDSSTFVDPSLLLTQSVDHKPVVRHAFHRSNSLNNIEPEVDLLEMICRMKKDISKPISTNSAKLNVDKLKSSGSQSSFVSLSSSFPSNMSKPKRGLTEDKLKTAFGTHAITLESEPNEFAHTTTKQIQEEKPKKMAPIFLKAKEITIRSDNGNSSKDSNISGNSVSSSTHKEASLGILSTEHLRRLEEEPAMMDEESQRKIKAYITQLKQHTDREIYKKFKSVVMNFKDNGLKQMSEVSKFVDDVIMSLGDMEDSQLAKTLNVLIPLIPLKFQAMYENTSRKSMQIRKAMQKNSLLNVPSHMEISLNQAALSKKPTSKTDLRISGKNSSSMSILDAHVSEMIESLPLSQSQSSTSSKRALMLLESSASNKKQNTIAKPFSIVSKSVAKPALFKQLDKIEGMQVETRKQSLSSNDLDSSKLKSCIICRNQAEGPYAAKCGHICCFDCWKLWLNVRKSCPLCRNEVTLETILKIVIVK